MKSLIIFLLVGLRASVSAEDTCDAEPQDTRVYSFAYGPDFLPYMDVKEDGKIYGLSYNLIRAVCKVMNKNCAHVAYYDWSMCWDSTKHSIALYNSWWDACVGFVVNNDRMSALGHVLEYAEAPDHHMYVKRGAAVRTINEIKSSSVIIGTVNGWTSSGSCLEKFLGISLAGRIDDSHRSYNDVADALDRGDVDVMFLGDPSAAGDSRIERVDSDSIKCSITGATLLVRKDMVHKLAWMEEGFQKIRDNGDYKWFCNNAERDGNPRCLD